MPCVHSYVYAVVAKFFKTSWPVVLGKMYLDWYRARILSVMKEVFMRPHVIERPKQIEGTIAKASPQCKPYSSLAVVHSCSPLHGVLPRISETQTRNPNQVQRWCKMKHLNDAARNNLRIACSGSAMLVRERVVLAIGPRLRSREI
jgi:hypothetical protein